MAGKHSMEYDDEIPKAFQKKYNEKESKTMNKKNKNGKRKNKKKSGLKTFGKIVLVLVVILAILSGGILWFIQNKIGKMQQIDINEEELGISEDTNLTGYRNIAIFGVDSREGELEKGNRSDCIMIASINNQTKEVKLISVYRDTYVNIEGHGLDKITHAYSYGSAPLAINTLNTNLDLNIKEFVTVNFSVVADAVEELGGITIKVESKDEIDNINYYIDEVAQETGLPGIKITSTGSQTFDGVQAVSYSRCRYTAGGDYKRTERMRTVLTAMVDKLKTKSIGEINRFMDNILPKVYTNISTGDILGLLPSLANFKITESIGWPYETKGITLDRWYSVPVTLESSVLKLHQEVFNDVEYTPSSKVKTISNSIITKTGYSK